MPTPILKKPPILKNQIIDWLKNQEYWFQYAGKQMLQGAEITDEFVTTVFNIFKEEYGLSPITLKKTKITFDEITETGLSSREPLCLKTIKEIENVNALAKGQSIELSKNLTIVYGGNGTGKSGYIRLLNNAFNSRGDKQILKNVFGDLKEGSPKCSFHFQSGDTAYKLESPDR